MSRTSEENLEDRLRIRSFATKIHNLKDLLQKFKTLADNINKSDTIDSVVEGSKEAESLKSSTIENIF
jgi:uncharacterized protein YoxC